MGNTSKPTVLPTPLLRLLLLLALETASSIPNTRVKTLLCNGQTYTRGDPFASSIAYVLAELESVTTAREGHDYFNISPFPNAFAYGHATCTANLTEADCSTYLVVAENDMMGACVMRIGARSVLYDCSIRYEQYPFTD